MLAAEGPPLMGLVAAVMGTAGVPNSLRKVTSGVWPREEKEVEVAGDFFFFPLDDYTPNT